MPPFELQLLLGSLTPRAKIEGTGSLLIASFCNLLGLVRHGCLIVDCLVFVCMCVCVLCVCLCVYLCVCVIGPSFGVVGIGIQRVWGSDDKGTPQKCFGRILPS